MGREVVSVANPTETPTRKLPTGNFQQGKTREAGYDKIRFPTRTKLVAAECILLEIIC